MAEQPKSRLDCEIDEILEKKSKEPIPFRSHPRVEKQRRHRQFSDWQNAALSAWRWLKGMPIVMAYAFVFLAILVHDASPLLALLLSTAAVVALWLPGILRLTRPAAASNNDVKYWRGRPYAGNVKSAASRSPVDSLKRYFDRRR